MMKLNRFTLLVALSSLALWIPAAATSSYGRSSAYLAAQQQAQPSQPPATQQSKAQQDQQPNASATQAPSQKQMVMLTGTIVQQNGAYVLKGSEQTYKLDAQDKAKGFEGRKVRVMGTLDTASNSIQVDSIKPAV